MAWGNAFLAFNRDLLGKLKNFPACSHRLIFNWVTCVARSLEGDERVFPVPNTRLSLVRHTSALKWFLGVHKWTGSPSRSNSISSQGINCLCHWKLFREITLACVHAAQASLLLDGLQNVLKMVCRGFSKKVLPQLMGLQIKIFLFFLYQMSIGQTHHPQTLSQTYCSFFGRPPC